MTTEINKSSPERVAFDLLSMLANKSTKDQKYILLLFKICLQAVKGQRMEDLPEKSNH